VRLLLDSHVIVWWGAFPARLRPETEAALRSPANEVFLSAASVWELGLKVARGKLSLPADYAARLLAAGFEELPVTVAHADRAMHLPPLHADPFDRLLIAQALAEGMVLVTSDRAITGYDVPLMPA